MSIINTALIWYHQETVQHCKQLNKDFNMLSADDLSVFVIYLNIMHQDTLVTITASYSMFPPSITLQYVLGHVHL